VEKREKSSAEAHSKSITKHEEELDAKAKKKEKVHKTKEKVKAKERLTKTKKKASEKLKKRKKRAKEAAKKKHNKATKKAHKEHRKKSEERRRLDAKKERRVKAKESHSKRQEDSCGCKAKHEGWCSRTKCCSAGSRTTPHEASACEEKECAKQEAPDQCGCRAQSEGWCSRTRCCKAGSRTNQHEAALCGMHKVVDSCGCHAKAEGWCSKTKCCSAGSHTTYQEASSCSAPQGSWERPFQPDLESAERARDQPRPALKRQDRNSGSFGGMLIESPGHGSVEDANDAWSEETGPTRRLLQAAKLHVDVEMDPDAHVAQCVQVRSSGTCPGGAMTKEWWYSNRDGGGPATTNWKIASLLRGNE